MKSSLDPIITPISGEYRTAFDRPRAASERATSETAGPAGVVAAVATGSLPAFVVELLYQIRARETEAAKNKARFNSNSSVNWHAYDAEESAWKSAAMLTEILAAARGVQIQRQPEENEKLTDPNERR